MTKSIQANIIYDKHLDRYVFRLQSPLSVCWQITTRCNLSCKYCLADADEHGAIGMSTQEACQTIDSLGALGVNRLDFTGGEPLIRQDICELILHAINNKISPIITTNTLMLSEQHVRFFKQHDIVIQVSIDGNAKFHNESRRKDVYHQTLANINRLITEGCRVRLNSFISKSNIDDLDELVTLGETLGIFSHLFILFTPQGRGIYYPEEILNKKTSKNLKKRIAEYKDQTKRNIRLYDYDEYAHSCVLLTPLGDVVSQAFHQKDCITVGNIFRKPLAELFQNKSFDHFVHLAHYTQKRVQE